MPSIGLQPDEIIKAFAMDDVHHRFPPVLSVPQAADLLGRPADTIRLWITQGKLKGAVRKRGKAYFIWRDRLIKAIFDGPEWRN